MKRLRLPTTAATAMTLLLSLASASDPPHPLAATAPAPDWQHVFERTDGWTGGDGAATIPLPGNRTLWLFGDSWIGPVRDGKHAPGSTLVNNAIAVQPMSVAPPAPDQITFLWGPHDDKRQPTAWIVPPADERAHEKNLRYWPAGGGIVTRDHTGASTLFLFFARIRDSGAEGAWNFEGCGTAIARIENPADSPSAWRVRQTTLTHLPKPMPRLARRVMWGAAAVEWRARPTTSAPVYIYGVDSTDGLNKKLLLARAPAETLDRFDSWSFYRGGPGSRPSASERNEQVEYEPSSAWTRDASDARPIADNIMDEFTINRIDTAAGPRLLMIYSKPILDDHIVSRIAARPEGPWTAPREIYRCPEAARDRRILVYSAKAHPELSRPGELLVSYCVNSTDFWHMASHAWIYLPRFIRIPSHSLVAD